MARKLMPKSGIMMPYVVANRDAQVAGVAYVDGKAGNIDLTGTYAKIDFVNATFAPIEKSYSKTESDGRYLQSHNIKVGYRMPIRAAGIPPAGQDDLEINLIEAAPFTTIQDTNGQGTPGNTQENSIIIGDLESGVTGVHIYSEGRTDVVYTNDGGELRSAPLYSQRYRPEIADMPFAAIGTYVKDSKGRTIGVDKSSGINADIKAMNNLATVSSKVTFEQPIKGQQATADDELVTRSQAITIANAATGGGGSGNNAATVLANFIGSVEWWQGSPDAIPKGYLPASGQLLSRTQYPELWAGVRDGIFTLINSNSPTDKGKDSGWIATRSARGSFSYGQKVANTDHSAANDGDATTGVNFRIPDLNGVQTAATLGVPAGPLVDSIKGLFLRGSGMAGVNNNETGSSSGVIRDSALPNLTAGVDGNTDHGNPTGNAATNPFTTGNPSNVAMAVTAGGTSKHALNFDASRQPNGGNGIGVPGTNSVFRNGTTEVRPNSVQGTWIIRATGAFDSGNTSVAITRNDATLPASGLQSGGHLSTRYQVAGKDIVASAFESQWTVGQPHGYLAFNVNKSDPTTGAFVEGGSLAIGSDGSVVLQNNATLTTQAVGSGSINVTGGFNISGGVRTAAITATSSATVGSIEIVPPSGGSGQAFIDFHHNRSASDFTQRIVTTGAGLEMVGGNFTISGGKVEAKGGLTCKPGLNGAFSTNGFNAEWNASSQLYLWIDNVPVCGWTGTTWVSASDKTLKQNIDYKTDSAKALDEINQWKPATFQYKHRGLLKDDRIHSGFIANDLKEISPDVVIGEGLKENDDIEKGNVLERAYGLDQMAMIAKLTLAVQALTARVAELEAK